VAENYYVKNQFLKRKGRGDISSSKRGRENSLNIGEKNESNKEPLSMGAGRRAKRLAGRSLSLFYPEYGLRLWLKRAQWSVGGDLKPFNGPLLDGLNSATTILQ